MERIITLLREKNHYLEKFLEVNEREFMNFESGNFDNIEDFYNTRDNILDLIRCIDDFLQEENDLATNDPRCTPAEKAEIEALLKKKEGWVTQILAHDLQILSCIEKAKSNIIRELQSVRTGRKAIHRYHSGEYSKHLDEKA